MNSLEKRLLRAMEEAPTQSLLDAYPEGPDPLAEAPDDEPVVGGDGYDRGPGSLYLTSREFLYMGALAADLGIQNFYLGDGTLASVLAHEEEHGWAACRLGAEGFRLGMQFYALGVETFRGPLIGLKYPFCEPHNYRMPKLALAAWLLAPVSHGGPSTADIQVVHNIGYTGGLEEVDQRIASWNRSSRKPYIPRPRYRPGD